VFWANSDPVVQTTTLPDFALSVGLITVEDYPYLKHHANKCAAAARVGKKNTASLW
jgi:hypothetical protein